MSENKLTVDTYLEGFRNSDHEMVLSCLTDDVEWLMPGAFHWHGKDEFDGEIENDAFMEKPEITCLRMIEENDVVISEGNVKSQLKDGTPFYAVFCDVFEMRGGKIKKLITYLMVVNNSEKTGEQI
jgi:ketosteroid isomerase-like protein